MCCLSHMAYGHHLVKFGLENRHDNYLVYHYNLNREHSATHILQQEGAENGIDRGLSGVHTHDFHPGQELASCLRLLILPNVL